MKKKHNNINVTGRRLIDREYTEVKVNNNRFKGIIGLVTMKKVRDPLEVTELYKIIVAK